MGQTTDQLRSELDRKRAELTRDVDRIEHKVRSTLDIRQQVAANPLPMTGLAVAAGFLLGNMVGGRREEKQTQRYGSSNYSMSGMGSAAYSPSSAGVGSIYDREPGRQVPTQQHHDGPSFFATFGEGVKDGFRRGAHGNSIEATVSHISAAMLAMLIDKAKDMLDSNLPGFAEKYEQISHSSSTSSAASTSYGGDYAPSRQDQPMTGAGGSAAYSPTSPSAPTSRPSGANADPSTTPRAPGH